MFSHLIEDALRVALEAHEGQYRRGESPVPYVSHPMHVSLLLARFGMDEELIAAALLHDVVEDCEEWTVEHIKQRFGPHVAAIVDDLTEDKSLGWQERKQWAIDHAVHMSPEAATVKAMDKLHNLETLVEQLRAAEDPADVWSRFRGGRESTLDMSGQLVDALIKRIDPRLARPLRKTMDALAELASRPDASPTKG